MSQDDLQRLQDDISRLRRNLAQQLTETGDIVGAIREIDEVLYGGQYFAPDEDDDDEDDFFADIRRARVLLTSLGNDLRHYQGAMAQLDAESDAEPGAHGSGHGSRLSDWEHQLAELDRQLHQARALSEEKEQALGVLRTQFEELQQRTQQHAGAQHEQHDLQQQLADARSQLEDLQGQLGSINWERESLKEELHNAQESLSQQRQEVQRAHEEQRTGQQQISDLQSSLEELRKQGEAHAQASASSEESKQQLQQVQEQLAQLEAQVRSISAERDELGENHRLLQQRLADEGEDQQRVQRRLQEIEGHLSVAIGERDRLRHELALAQARNEESLGKLRKELEGQYNDTLKARTTEIANLRKSLSESEAAHKGVQQELRKATSPEQGEANAGQKTTALAELRWQLDNERSRNQEELKSWQRRDGELRKLLEVARAAVLQAKKEREQREAVARSMIDDLQQQLRELRQAGQQAE